MIIYFNDIKYPSKEISNPQYNNLEIHFSSSQCVPDSIKGILSCKDNKWNFDIKEKIITTKSAKHQLKSMKKIAIILESPHKDEYSQNFKPILPAQGKTGRQLEKYLVNRAFIRCLDESQKYLVLLINPVQLQTSCYNLLTEKSLPVERNFTQIVFRFLFGKRGVNLREDFINRLKIYSPHIIVNCCTSSFKKTVETAIKEANYMDIKCDKHPSVWY